MKENKQDLVAVVRCEDCRYYYPAVFDGYEPIEPPYCDKLGGYFDDPPFYFGDEPRDDPYDRNNPYDYYNNGFCAWGERKLTNREINSLYNNAPQDIKDIVEMDIMSKKDITYMMARRIDA